MDVVDWPNSVRKMIRGSDIKPNLKRNARGKGPWLWITIFACNKNSIPSTTKSPAISNLSFFTVQQLTCSYCPLPEASKRNIDFRPGDLLHGIEKMWVSKDLSV